MAKARNVRKCNEEENEREKKKKQLVTDRDYSVRWGTIYIDFIIHIFTPHILFADSVRPNQERMLITKVCDEINAFPV